MNSLRARAFETKELGSAEGCIPAPKPIPPLLASALRPITVIAGHYGSGKTNFAINLAIDLAGGGSNVTLVDLDIVNPYFRASEQRSVLEEAGVKLIAPVFAEAGTSLDVPSLTGSIAPALEGAHEGSYVIVDAGGDDAGATALGRFAAPIRARGYALLCVLNRYRNLVKDPADAVSNLREIEAASHLKASGLVSNAHMKAETDPSHIEEGLTYAQEVAALTGLPLVGFTTPLHDACGEGAYWVQSYVKTPWE